MNNELYALVNELNFKKDVLDTKTNAIVDGIKTWCLEENDRINKEFDGLVKFANENINLFWSKNMTTTTYVTTYYLEWCGLRIVGNMTNEKCGLIRGICLDSNYEYKRHFGFMWTDLPKPTTYDYHKFFDKTDVNNTDVTYWTDYKGWLAIRNEYLCEVTKRVKDYLGTLILEQDKRFNDMNKACKEIDEDNTETIEIKVKVRV